MLFYNFGWNGGPNYDSPIYSTTELDPQITGAYADYRFFLTDAPDWTTSASLALDIKRTEETCTDISSVVLYYRAPGGTDTFPPLIHDDLLPPVRPYRGTVIEAEDLVATAQFTHGLLLTVDDSDRRYGVNGDKFISFAPFGFTDALTLRLPVKTEGEYTLSARLVAGPSGGNWAYTLNEAPEGKEPKTINCLDEETRVPGIYPYGWLPLGKYHLQAGDNTITFTSRPLWIGAPQRGLLLGLDAFLLAPATN
ncbi:MAG TPA: hypothetical protein VGM23_18105, partial [Armatimonadota bacterium]